MSEPLTDEDLAAFERLDSTTAKDVAHVDVMAYRALDAVPRLVTEVRRLREGFTIAVGHNELDARAVKVFMTPELVREIEPETLKRLILRALEGQC